MKEFYLKRAEENRPELIHEKITPNVGAKLLKKGESAVIDLGNHYVGYFSFRMNWVEKYVDAPIRLRIRFCEEERELCDDYTTYHGTLNASWLQEEVIHVDFPEELRMPRRYAARFIKITAELANRPFELTDFCFDAVSSGDVTALPQLKIADPELARIDAVAVNTLKNCMQRVFEDGPKRDRRLWLGDLRLEALTNYVTFGNNALVRRCLYLFAAATDDETGFIVSHIFDYPQVVNGRWILEDYSIFFASALCDYYAATGDRETFFELYGAAKSQLDTVHSTLREDGTVEARGKCDVFIDWCAGDLKKNAALNGVYLYTLETFAKTLHVLGHPDAEIYEDRLEKGRTAARKAFYNEEKNAVISERDGYQHSVHATVWMILGGVIAGERAVAALEAAIADPDSLKPGTPYMHHYVLEALMRLGQKERAREYLKDFWGAMVARGADTFYEAFVKEDPDFSPYGDRRINSLCHAWSCTPAYFIRKYFCD